VPTKSEIKLQRPYELIIRFIDRRPRSRKEIVDRLRQYGLTSSECEEVALKLRDINLIDDFSFARWWVEQRVYFRPRGIFLLKRELSQKGVSRDTIERVCGEIDEIEVARGLLAKLAGKWSNLDNLERRRRLFGYLLRRGFDMGKVGFLIDDAT